MKLTSWAEPFPPPPVVSAALFTSRFTPMNSADRMKRLMKNGKQLEKKVIIRGQRSVLNAEVKPTNQRLRWPHIPVGLRPSQTPPEAGEACRLWVTNTICCHTVLYNQRFSLFSSSAGVMSAKLLKFHTMCRYLDRSRHDVLLSRGFVDNWVWVSARTFHLLGCNTSWFT